MPAGQRGHSQNRGLSVIVNWIFLIMVLSWPEDYSAVLGMSSCGPPLLIWQLSSVCLLTSLLYLSCWERQLPKGAIYLKSSQFREEERAVEVKSIGKMTQILIYEVFHETAEI